jgi:uncharacterized protein YqgC (DUF456 family)
VTSPPVPRKRSLPLLLIVSFVPAVAAGIAGATAVGGSKAIVFGAVFGVVLGALTLGFALFFGWYTHRR